MFDVQISPQTLYVYTDGSQTNIVACIVPSPLDVHTIPAREGHHHTEQGNSTMLCCGRSCCCCSTASATATPHKLIRTPPTFISIRQAHSNTHTNMQRSHACPPTHRVRLLTVCIPFARVHSEGGAIKPVRPVYRLAGGLTVAVPPTKPRPLFENPNVNNAHSRTQTSIKRRARRTGGVVRCVCVRVCVLCSHSTLDALQVACSRKGDVVVWCICGPHTYVLRANTQERRQPPPVSKQSANIRSHPFHSIEALCSRRRRCRRGLLRFVPFVRSFVRLFVRSFVRVCVPCTVRVFMYSLAQAHTSTTYGSSSPHMRCSCARAAARSVCVFAVCWRALRATARTNACVCARACTRPTVEYNLPVRN